MVPEALGQDLDWAAAEWVELAARVVQVAAAEQVVCGTPVCQEVEVVVRAEALEAERGAELAAEREPGAQAEEGQAEVDREVEPDTADLGADREEEPGLAEVAQLAAEVIVGPRP